MFREGQRRIAEISRTELNMRQALVMRGMLTGILITNILARISAYYPYAPELPETSTSATQPSKPDKVSAAARNAYTSTPTQNYLNRFSGSRVDYLDCSDMGTPFGDKILVGIGVVADPNEGNNIHAEPELSSRVVDLLYSGEVEASKRVLVVNNYGSEEIWVDVSTPQQPGFIMASSRSGQVEDVYAGTPGLLECRFANQAAK